MKKILASVLVLTSLSCFSVMSSYAANEPMCYSNSSYVCNSEDEKIFQERGLKELHKLNYKKYLENKLENCKKNLNDIMCDCG